MSDKKIENIVSLWHNCFNENEKKLLYYFAKNILTIGIRNKIVGSNKHPTNIEIRENIPETVDSELKDILFSRIRYWVDRQEELDWSLEIGFQRRRSNKNFSETIGIKTKCEWPGCNNDSNLQADHRFPYSLGGSTDSMNSQTLCSSCNLSKSDSLYSITRWPGE